MVVPFTTDVDYESEPRSEVKAALVPMVPDEMDQGIVPMSVNR